MKPLFSALLCLLFLTGCEQTPPYSRLEGYTMGTTYHISLKASQTRADSLRRRIDKRLADINQLMSTYIEDSELSRFNALESTECQTLSAETIKVLRAAREISEQSGGAFDITVAPLIELWGFDKKDTHDAIPTEKELSSLRQRIGFEKLQLRQNELGQDCISKSSPTVSANLSAIAKGYGVDAIAELLRNNGITDFMVEIGGEIQTQGKNPRGLKWQIAVEKPSAGTRQVQEVLQVSGVGIATSGDYRNYFEKDGQRYSHTIDPTTGRPITHSLASVTVIMDDTMHADGWATAFMVMGEQKAYDYANAHDIAAYFIYKSENGFCEAYSAKFAQYFKQKPKNAGKLVYNCAP